MKKLTILQIPDYGLRGRRYLILTISLFIIIAVSCSKEEAPSYNYFISKEKPVIYQKATVSGMIDLASAAFPELAGLKPYITTDVYVYKTVYRTTLDGTKIEASGLICTPSLPGSYPVLSFQNGTNTLNSYAPSNYITNPSYQLVEFIAAMGFIVLVPDYPGFGRSKANKHPYLISQPTVSSVVDMIAALNEAAGYEFPSIEVKNEYFLMGYSQGGWATLAVHKELEQNYQGEYNLKGSVCGAGPYDLYDLLSGMTALQNYPMPSYIGYIIDSYDAYNQFANPVSEILNEPYATRLASLFNGTLSLDQINSQLTGSVSGLFRPEFLNGFAESTAYSTVRSALVANSISAWDTEVPLRLYHGQSDTHVSVSSTELMYSRMLAAGTPEDLIQKVIFPSLDHGDAIIPCLIDGLRFILDLRSE